MAVIIIAEAGVNHNGSVELAKKMVDAAANAGADYIKFQTFQPEKLVSRYAEKAEYQKQTTDEEESQLEMLRKLALNQNDFLELKAYCQEQGLGFISTPFDLESIDFLERLDMDFWKLPSGEVTDMPYLIKIAKTGRPIVMSTGMCEMEEVIEAIHCLKNHGSGEITLLHCNTEYPTPMKDVNLRAMATLREQCRLAVGYSDHTKGIEIPVAAVALGATVIEKHFTMDRTMEGPDHRASLEPEELKDMVMAIRHVEQALGDGVKCPSESERKNRAVARKSIVAKCSILKGETFTEENLTTKRPGLGISPMRWNDVLGRQADRNYTEDELIEEGDS